MSPRPKGKVFRELTDVLLSHQFGSILIESKCLIILSRPALPDRTKLKHDVTGHIEKATRQLQGAMRRLKGGVTVTTLKRDKVEAERTNPMHGIVLIPDLDLIDDRAVYGKDFIETFSKETGGFIHPLDMAELLRMVQAAEAISARSRTATPMMAFDCYLIERYKKQLMQESSASKLCLDLLKIMKTTNYNSHNFS